MKFIVRENNYNQIVMSKEFETLDQPLMVEIIRRRQRPATRPLCEQPHVDISGQSLNIHFVDFQILYVICQTMFLMEVFF